MYIPNLTIGIKNSLPREFDPHAWQGDLDYSAKRLRILERDHYTCLSCGFQTIPDRKAQSFSLVASGYLEVHHIDDDHNNNDDNNLISLCPFCHSCHHIGFGGTTGRIVLGIIPQLTQEQLNILCNLCLVAMFRGGSGLAAQAEQLYSQILATSSYFEDIFETGDVSIVSGALGIVYKKNTELYAQREKALQYVRVIPSLLAFNEAVNWWQEHTWLPGENWEKAWYNLAESAHGL